MVANYDKFGLTAEQTEILYNIERLKTLNDIECTTNPSAKALKKEWLSEWERYMTMGFEGFVGDSEAKLEWYKEKELINHIFGNDCTGIWFRLVLLEAMLFEPYYPLSTEEDKNGNTIPNNHYKGLFLPNGTPNPITGYYRQKGDTFLDRFMPYNVYNGYASRLRKSYNNVMRELNEVLRDPLKGVVVAAGIALVVAITAGTLAPHIAVLLVGSQFAGLSGAALTSACLAYLGGGAVAAGGLGMAGGTAAIVGGGALLGGGLGIGIGDAVSVVGTVGKEETIRQSAKLLVSVREIFLNDEHDIDYANTVFEQYVQKISDLEKSLVDLKIKADIVSKEEKKELEDQIENIEESVSVMKIAMRIMNRFNSSFQEGMSVANETDDYTNGTVIKGNDVHMKVEVFIPKTDKGSELSIKCIDNSIKLKITKDTKSGTIFRVRRKGLLNAETGERGDLYVKVIGR